VTVEVEGLTHDYGDLRALDGVSFEIAKGEVFGVLGPNGAGKSTAVRILLGLMKPVAGRARVAGIDVQQDPVGARERLGYVPEFVTLYEGLTASEHLWFVGRLRRLGDDVIRRRVTTLLDGFDLTAFADEPIRSFSKGMRQKVALSLAFLHRPDVLILDEPLAGLDAGASLLLKELIRGFAQRGTAVLYCSHVLDVVEKVCERALILDKGKMRAMGTLNELRASTRGTTLEEVFRSVASVEDPTIRAARLLRGLDGDE